jgi:Cys-rich four helix bundle protein (predicted Tat secretion target)
MDRRDALRTLAAVATPVVVAAQQQHVHPAGGPQTLIVASSDCAVKAETCLAHCQQLLAAGDKTMGPCAKTTSETLALCTAVRTLAIQGAPSLPKLAAVAMDACRRCEAECRKHEKVHPQCKDCAEACVACAAECRKIASA